MTKPAAWFEDDSLWILPSGAVIDVSRIVSVSPVVVTQDGKTPGLFINFGRDGHYATDDVHDIAAFRAAILKRSVELTAPDVKEPVFAAAPTEGE